MKKIFAVIVLLSAILLVACSSGKQGENSSFPTSNPSQTDAPSSSTESKPTAGLEEGSKEEGVSSIPTPGDIEDDAFPGEAASPSLVPTPGEDEGEAPSPTATPSPTPLPTSTPTPLPTATPSPLPTQIPVEEMSFVYEIQRGDNVWYRFTEDTLYVTGTGKVDVWKNCHNYNLDTELHINLENTKKIVIEEGITEIGDWAFYGALVAKELYLPKTLTYIGEYAFYMFGISCESYSADVYGLDKDRITIATCAFGMSSIGDEELTVLPTPTPTPSPIPAPKEEVDPNNPKRLARVQMGDSIFFEFYDTGELYVKGSGRTWDMPLGFSWIRDYARDKYPHIPVFEKEYADSMTVCYVEDNVTYLGTYIFWNLSGISEVSVPSTIEKGDCGISIRNFHFREE